MLKNVTITVDEEALRWARLDAADRGISVSKLVGQMLEREMRKREDYWKAFERWKKIKPVRISGPIREVNREADHERR